VLTPEETARAEQRLEALLRDHELDWVVRRVDDALQEGRQPESGAVEDLRLRRLILLIEATERALAMSTRLERAVPELLLEGTGGRRVRIEPDPEETDPRLRPPLVIDRDDPERAPSATRHESAPLGTCGGCSTRRGSRSDGARR
jgi:hypothetical protein